MRLIAGIVRELLGLFVDDGMLAVAIVAVIGVSSIVAIFIPGLAAGAVLLGGLLLVLFANVMAH